MSEIAIRVENLSKRYRIGIQEEQHDTFVGAMLHGLRNPMRNLRRLRRLSNFRSNGRSATEEEDVIWALKDVSFEVKRGEVIGVIGRNGAGKSTLLKILSRITHPTSGRVELHGRVSSLLEVGTGFHPELTGRENIYLNGTILGMRKREIDRKFDEIVEFSGVEKFIDTPVKRYSSGMRVRLAFSVAAHLEPEILLVDEVLAVGDIEFQRKCLGKMEEVSQSGRTVLFVSHNMAMMESLCERVVLLVNGYLDQYSKSRDIIAYYTEYIVGETIERIPLPMRLDRRGDGRLRLVNFYVEDSNGKPINILRSGMDVTFAFGFQKSSNFGILENVDIGFSIHSPDGQTLFILYSSYKDKTFEISDNTGVFLCQINNLPLPPGKYQVGARITVQGQEADWPNEGVGYIFVEEGNFYGTGRDSKGISKHQPLFLLDGQWRLC